VKSDFTGDKDFVSMCFFVGDLFSSRDWDLFFDFERDLLGDGDYAAIIFNTDFLGDKRFVGCTLTADFFVEALAEEWALIFEADFFGVYAFSGDLVSVLIKDFFGVLTRLAYLAGDFAGAFLTTTLGRLYFLSCDLFSREFDCFILLDFLSSTCFGLVC
jgi:hypothetical protein